MENFDYHRRTFILFGRGREEDIGSLVKYEDGHRVLCVYTSEVKQRSELVDRINLSLDRSGLECFNFEIYQEWPDEQDIKDGINSIRNLNIDFVIAIGNSSLFDGAKVMATGALYNGDFMDFFSGLREPVSSLPLGCVVTTPDAGSECSSNCEILKEVDGVKVKVYKSSYAFLPRFAILNPELSLNLPKENIATCCMDMIAHILGCYFTNTPNVELTDELCEGTLRTIVHMLPRVMSDSTDYDAWANIMLAGTLAQNGMCSLGREVDWSYVLLEHELLARYPQCKHGHALAVLLPAWMSFCLTHDMMRTAQLGARVFDLDVNFDDPRTTAEDAITSFRNFLSRLGLPRSLKEMGLHSVDVGELVASLGLAPGETIGSYVRLDSHACEIIYGIAYNYSPEKLEPFDISKKEGHPVRIGLTFEQEKLGAKI